MDPMIDAKLEWSRLRRDELGEIAELIAACDYIDDPVDRVGLAELEDLAAEIGDDLGENGLVGRDRAGTAVACALVVPRGGPDDELQAWLHFAVHPAARHRNFGHKMVDWMCQRSLEWRTERGWDDRPLWLGAFVDAKLTRRAESFIASGLSAERWYVDMHVSFDEVELVAPTVRDGVEIRPFDADHSEAVRLVHNQAFSTQPGTHRVGRDEWEASLVASTSRPQWSCVAIADGQVVGYAMNSAYEMDWERGSREGWTDRIGVLASHRSLGIGRALVQTSLLTFASAGMSGAGLGVDANNHEEALRMFSSLGYQESDSVVLYGRTVA